MPSYSLRFLCCLLLAATFTARAAQGQFAAASAAAKAAVVAPYLDEQTLAVARIDLRQLEPAEIVKTLGRIAPPDDKDFPKQLGKFEQNARRVLQALRSAGVNELYVVVSLSDLPKEPFFVVAPLAEGMDANRAAPMLKELLVFKETDARNGAVVLGKAATIERLKKLQPAARPEVLRGFERTGNAAVEIVISPSDDTRRVVREMLPRLPDEFGGGSGKSLAEGLEWAAVAIHSPPRLSLSATIQSRDPESAAALRGIIVSALHVLARNPDVRKQWPEVDELARLIAPRLRGDQLLLNISDDSGDMEQVLRLAIAPLQAARTAAGRAQSMNNLKQLGLALHNYHDVYNQLPPQSIRGKDGKQLLSWRVAVLPWLDAMPLYQQFKLDEPWDSEHNKALIAKMPAVFASPALGDERRSQGLTSYLAPLSRPAPAFVTTADFGAKSKKAPKGDMVEMIFDVAEGTTMKNVTDGLSNTALLVEANPSSAVIWTKPEDLVIAADDPFRGLRDQPNAFGVLFGDGSVRMVSYNVDPKTLLHVFQMNDGQPPGELK